MTAGRVRRLEAARRVDWRFLLSHPDFERVACLHPADDALSDALATLGIDVSVGTVAQLARTRRRWPVVLLGSGTHDPAAASAAMPLVEPGGWLVAELQGGGSGYRGAQRARRAFRSPAIEVMRRYWHLPTRASATRLVSLDDPVAMRAAIERHAGRRRRRVIARLARLAASVIPVGWIGGDVTLAARTTGGALPFDPWATGGPLAHALAAWPGAGGWSSVLLTPRYPASAHVLFMFLDEDGRPRLVAKVARLPEDAESVDREAAALDQLHASAVRGSVPTVVAHDRLGDHAVLVETALEGRPLDRLAVRRDPRRWIAAADEWLARLPVEPASGQSSIASLVEPALSQIADAAGSAEAHLLVTRARSLLVGLGAASLGRPFEHGDLSHPNIIITHGGQFGVLDWEAATPAGLPLHDLCHFLGYVGLSTAPKGEDPFDGLLRVIAHPAWNAVRSLTDAARRHGASPESIPSLVLACWTRTLARRTESLGSVDQPPAGEGPMAGDRYYALWMGAVRHHDRLVALFS